MKLIYDEESGIPTNLKEGDELFLFDSEAGALHVCTFQSYGIDKNQEPTVTVVEDGGEKTYTAEGVADIVFQADYPCR